MEEVERLKRDLIQLKGKCNAHLLEITVKT
jgi:hypothetical protein